MDYFRNGSVIQLKSKVTQKTLAMRDGGLIDCDGKVGFYVGTLGSGTPVWALKKDSLYCSGEVTNNDSRIHIKFNDGDIISHDFNDKSAVLLDTIPDVEALQIGSRLIAQHKGSTEYCSGWVMNIDMTNPKNPVFEVNFDDGDKQGHVHLHQLRLLLAVNCTTLGSPNMLAQCHVIGRWSNDQYYRGIVTRAGSTIDIQFDNGDKIQHDPSDIAAVILDVNPRPGTVQVGCRVIGCRPSSHHFYCGRVVQIDYMDPHSPRYYVSFDDNTNGWCKLDEIRTLPMRCETVGCAVFARSTNKFFYQGHVTECSHGKIHITFDNDTGQGKISHYTNDTKSVIIDSVPNPADVSIGSRVIASWMFTLHYLTGFVTEIDSTDLYTPRYHVNFDGNGGQFWVNFDQVRLIPMEANEIGAVVWVRRTDNLYYKGRIERTDSSKIHIIFDDGKKMAHSPSDITAIILDVTPNARIVSKGSRVLADLLGSSMLYPATVQKVDKHNPCQLRYYVHYDGGNKGWVYHKQIKPIPVPGPCTEAQFSVVHIDGNVVALQNIAFPQYFLGINGDQVIGKEFDKNCHMYVHETQDQFVSLSFCMFPGQYIGISHDGQLLPPNSTRHSEQTYFEVKLLFSPYGQSCQADHSSTGRVPGHNPCYQLSLDYPPPVPNGARDSRGPPQPEGQ